MYDIGSFEKMSIAEMINPLEHITMIINRFVNSLELQSQVLAWYPGKNDDIILSSNNVLLMLEGEMTLQRRKDDFVIDSFCGPWIVNLNIFDFDLANKCYISRNSKFSYILYEREVFFSFIEKNHLWDSVFYVMSFEHRRLFNRFEVITLGNLYDIVKYYLNYIDKTPELKNNENICRYIELRTGFSRSGIMSILKELRKGNYIEIAHGKLKRIKTLPVNF